MSNAGIHSNRGDGYQTLIAFDWVLSVLSDPDFQWVEIDSVNYQVDDVVIGKTDGTLICCQCKKNQSNYRAWSIADLADELNKAAATILTNSNIKVRFYSRTPFGVIAKLREHNIIQENEGCYRASLSQDNRKTDEELEKILKDQTSKLSTFEFLRRTEFETSGEIDSLERKLRERLRSMVNNPDSAYDALWRHIDQIGGRLLSNNGSAAPSYRFSKEVLLVILQQAGIILAPNVNLADVRTFFAGTSAIGRSWQRNIASTHIRRPIIQELLIAIGAGKRSILLTGMPGSGKTCVILEIQDELEKRAKTDNDIVPLFIQAREFADLTTAEERQAQGLNIKWVEQAARLAEEVRVVIVIDSLDVLSIAREHNVLKYFLAQIDRLLLIQNISVITTCRDFDRHYDRQIASRQWDCEMKCLALNWETEVSPILASLGIQTSTIGNQTRELICNPRELALFVELAQSKGSFNVITSQELAQRYLNTIVLANETLGETALHAIETSADEMVKSRNLAIPQQRFNATQNIKRSLCSLNILQETQDGKLTFGHQTLLDVLVISRALRIGYSLHEFIQRLPPVPFVRPSIRSFIAHLTIGDRSEFRKQLRTVLTGNVAFHIRRLTAEAFAEQMPQDDDWPLLRDLHNKHRDVFQVIYAQSEKIEWHYFWFKYLVPKLKETRDIEGLSIHTNKVAKWKDEDPKGVVKFWTEMLSLDWFDSNRIVGQLGLHINSFSTENLMFTTKLLEKLINTPSREHNFLGYAVARCIAEGLVDDSLLWHYITGDVSDDVVIKNKLDEKLYCLPHEFGDNDKNFFSQRMKQSSKLLELAIKSIELWSQLLSARYGGTNNSYHNEFLNETSYERVHCKSDMYPVDSTNDLLDAVESAILCHAETNSSWWQSNRERLCHNTEGALLYFGILACTKKPEVNIGLIESMLCDKELMELEFTDEFGELINASFIYLGVPEQDKVITIILTLWDDINLNVDRDKWIQRQRAKLSAYIPCYLRSSEIQMLIEVYEKENGLLICEPETRPAGGWVQSPFSFENFLNTSDKGVLRLLAHYTGYTSAFDDFLIGGAREVGSQLCEASSRHPTRFLRLLSAHWSDISAGFYDEIMRGVSNYLSYRYGSLRSNETWSPIVEPDVAELTNLIIDELERHTKHWHHNHAASEAIEACANVIKDIYNAGRLVFISIGFANVKEDENYRHDLLTTGMNMTSGNIAEALMILANGLQEAKVPFPELLLPTIYRFTGHKNPAIRALVLRRLPYLQYKNPVLGWDLFQRAMKDANGLWEYAETCLHNAYFNRFDIVAPLLKRIYNEGSDKDMETWGRISALAAITNHIAFPVFFKDLDSLNSIEAWQGAASVWTNMRNLKQFQEQCFSGIEAGLNADNRYAECISKKMENLFGDKSAVIFVPQRLMKLFFDVLMKDSKDNRHSLYGFSEWLNSIAMQNPDLSLFCTELYLDYVKHFNSYLYDHDNNLTQLITRLFEEAEEKEEADQGAMLQRVISIQDTLLALGVNSINDWLKAAERP